MCSKRVNEEECRRVGDPREDFWELLFKLAEKILDDAGLDKFDCRGLKLGKYRRVFLAVDALQHAAPRGLPRILRYSGNLERGTLAAVL